MIKVALKLFKIHLHLNKIEEIFSIFQFAMMSLRWWGNSALLSPSQTHFDNSMIRLCAIELISNGGEEECPDFIQFRLRRENFLSSRLENGDKKCICSTNGFLIWANNRFSRHLLVTWMDKENGELIFREVIEGSWQKLKL